MDNNCVFCDRAKFIENLIAETDEHYIVASLGQIIAGYTLVIPKDHISCVGAFSRSQAELMFATMEYVCQALALEYHQSKSHPYPVTIFEHGIVGQTIDHAHLHIVPTAIDLTPKIRADFPKTTFEEVHYPMQLPELYSKRKDPYLLWTVPNGNAMVCWNPAAPPQYLRLIMAQLLGFPERGDWRSMDPELDKQLRQETVARLKPYCV